MKKIILVAAALSAAMACQKYVYDTNFSAPDELISPESVNIDLASAENVVLSWRGGGAEDGGICLYSVLFDEADGDFSSPLATMQSDNGGLAQLTLTQASLNNIARSAGILPLGSGSVKWTVTASRGGEIKQSEASAVIAVTRPDGIDNMPDHLYLDGEAAGTDGQGREFRMMSEGIYRIYTTLSDGDLTFRSSMGDDANYFYYDESTGALREGQGTTAVAATGPDELVRITLDFNARTMKTEHLDKTVYYVLGINGNTFVELHYDGSGRFSYTGLLPYVRDQWGAGAHEERYYFRVQVDGVTTYWGRGAGISAEQPSANESIDFYVLHEYIDFSQMWNFAWKLKWDYFDRNTKVTIDTDADNLMIHTFEFVD